jgi:nicotinamide phosphoribosyltransferase
VMLADTFGATLNQDGFLVLDPHIGLIYGDGITLESMTRILEGMKKKGFCANNVVFGLGSYTFQYVTRDSHGIALKATHCILDGVGHAVTKDPKTDDGLKKSASGLLAVHCDANGRLYLKENCTEAEEREGLLETVWLDGVELGFEYLSEVRARLGVF